MRAVGGAFAGKGFERIEICVVREDEIAGFFGITGIGLNFPDNGKRNASLRPSLIKPDLFGRRIACAVAKRIRHCRLDQPVLQNGAAGKLQRLFEHVGAFHFNGGMVSGRIRIDNKNAGITRVFCVS